MTSPTDWVQVSHLDPALVQLSQSLHSSGVQAIEWGTGLNCSLGAPVAVFVHFWIIPEDQYASAIDTISRTPGFERTEPTAQQGHLGASATCFAVPDSCGRDTLAVLHTGHVPLDLARIHFCEHDELWRPDLIATAWSYLRDICLTGKNDSLAHIWLSEFVVYVLCGVKYIEKTAIEGEMYIEDKEQDEREAQHGLAVISRMEWRGELAWLRNTLEKLVQGQQSYDQFTREWWEEQNAE